MVGRDKTDRSASLWGAGAVQPAYNIPSDDHVGVYSSLEAPVKLTITRDGATLFFQPPGAESAAPLEAMAQDKFQIEGAAVIEFDAAKNQMTIKRCGGERVFTKEK
jgi:hypothetical protein